MEQNFKKRFLEWRDIDDAIERLAINIKKSGIEISAIKGLQRGGLIPAVMLSHSLGIPMTENKIVSSSVLIVDDICDTGGTLVKAAALLKEKGARTVRALITHPVLSGKAYENIDSSVLEELVVCDTIPLKSESTKIKVLTVADLFAIAIRNAYENKSITSLFVHSQLKARNQ